MATTPLRPVSKLFPGVGDSSSTTPPGASSSMTPLSSLPKVEEDDGADGDSDTGYSTTKLFDNVKGTILDSDRCISQVKASESAAVEELALKSFALIDTQDKVLEEKRKVEKAEQEIKELKNVISTMELSIEKHVITCANLNIENKSLKAEVRDLKNQLTISRSSQELLVDNNSLLTNEVTDCRRNAEEDKVIIASLRRDLRSYELLHQSQPSHMYSEIMNQSRISLEEENVKLRDKLYVLMSKFGADSDKLLIEGEVAPAIQFDKNESKGISNISIMDNCDERSYASSSNIEEKDDSLSISQSDGQNDSQSQELGEGYHGEESEVQMVIEEMSEA